MTRLRKELETALTSHFQRQILHLGGGPSDIPPLVLAPPTDEKFGDYTTKLPFELASHLRMSPLKIGQTLINDVDHASSLIENATVVNNGFINFHMNWDYWHHCLIDVIEQGLIDHEPSDSEREKVQIELALSEVSYSKLKNILDLMENNLRLLDVQSFNFNAVEGKLSISCQAYYLE